MSEGVVRKIQPFTIGTRLSVPSEAKSQLFVDVALHRSAALNKLEQQNNLHDQLSIFRGQSQPGNRNFEFQQVEPRANALTQEEIQDERVEDDRTSVSPTASSRSIRKIAICRKAEMVQNLSLCDLTNPVKSMLETNKKCNNCVHTNPPSTKIEEHLEQGSNSQSKVDTWFKRTFRDWKHGCSYLCGPLPNREVMSPTEQRDVKDTECSLIQLTKDLSDGPLYETLEVEPDSKVEKRKRLQQPEFNAISSRESASQNCLRVQSLLRDYHQDLKLALDVSSFYQQADNIICTIKRKRSVQAKSDDQGSFSQTEINNIAGQIMMLNHTVSRLSGLHPTLAARVTWKQAEVQESWGLLRGARRSNWPDMSTTPAGDFSCDNSNPVSQSRDTQGAIEHKAQVMIRKYIKKEEKHLNGFKNMKDFLVTRELTVSQVEKQHPQSHAQVSTKNNSYLDYLSKRCIEKEREEQKYNLNTFSPSCQSELSVHLQKSTTSADKTLSWLKDNLAMTNPRQHSASLDDTEVASKVPTVIHQDNDVPNSTLLGVFEWEKPMSIESQHQGDVEMEDLLGQVEKLWEVLRSRHQSSMTNANSTATLNWEMDDNQKTDKAQPEKRLLESSATMGGFWSVPDVNDLYETSEDNKTGMLTGLPGCLEQHDIFDLCEGEEQSPCGPTNHQKGMDDPQGELLGIMDDISEAVEKSGHSLFQSHDTRNLMSQLLSRCAELSMDILDTKADMAVRCAPDISGLEGLQEQQDELEKDYDFIREEVEKMERLASRLLLLLPDKSSALKEEIQTAQQAWEELGSSMGENRSHLQQFRELQDFLMDYLAMISWTEDTQILICSEASTQQWNSAEITVPSELYLRIQQMFVQFEKLAAAGQKLIKEQHHLTDIIKERTEELQSMLGWIMVHWRAQKDQLVRDKLKVSIRSEDSKAESTNHSPCQPQNLISLPEPNKSSESLKTMVGRRVEQAQKPGSRFDGTPKRPELGHREPNFAKPANASSHIPSALGANPPRIVLEKPCDPVALLGNSISLILSFDQQPPGGSLLLGLQKEAVEPVHRVSTYLQVTGGSPVSEAMASPNASLTSSKDSACSTFIPKVSTVSLSNLAQTRSTATLNLNGAMKRRKKLTHRHTVTGIFGMPKPEGVPNNAIHRANTWPLEDNKESCSMEGSMVNTEPQLYVKNKSVVNVRQNSLGTSIVSSQKDHYLHGINEIRNLRKDEKLNIIPLGSTLSFDLPKEWGCNLQISVKDLTTDKGPLENKGVLVSPNSSPLNCVSPTASKPPGQTPESSKVIGRTFAASQMERQLEVDRELDSPNGSHSIQYTKPGSNTACLTHKIKLAGSNTLSQSYNVIGPSLRSKVEQSCDTATKDLPEISSESISLLLQSVSLSENVGAGLNSNINSPVHGVQHNNNSFSTIGINDKPKFESNVPVAILNSTEQCIEPICSNPMLHNNMNTETSESHKCLSVHTKVRDLNGHIYSSSPKRQFTFQSDLQIAEIKSLSNVSEDSTSTWAKRSGRVIVCSEENCCVCSDSFVAVMVTANETSSMTKPEPVHPDHCQFEEEEEELEDIWNGTDRKRAP